ncbi:MAG: class I SAM-dependent methyltransferase [Candidatus Berkelbacteria bacterium]
MKRTNKNFIEQFYQESKFGGFTDIDSTIAFYSHINSIIKNNFQILNIGCGRGIFQDDKIAFRRDLQKFKGRVKKVTGIDVDPAAKNNPDLDEFKLIEKNIFPIRSNSIDLCICDFVVEHVENPALFFKECQRVLKKAGYLFIRTTNIWGYIGIAALLIPNKKHPEIIKKIQSGRTEIDIFPKYYRANSLLRLSNLLKKNNFEYVSYGFTAEPSYFDFSKIFYGLASFIHKLTPNYFKLIIFAFARKK